MSLRKKLLGAALSAVMLPGCLYSFLPNIRQEKPNALAAEVKKEKKMTLDDVIDKKKYPFTYKVAKLIKSMKKKPKVNYLGNVNRYTDGSMRRLKGYVAKIRGFNKREKQIEQRVKQYGEKMLGRKIKSNDICGILDEMNNGIDEKITDANKLIKLAKDYKAFVESKYK